MGDSKKKEKASKRWTNKVPAKKVLGRENHDAIENNFLNSDTVPPSPAQASPIPSAPSASASPAPLVIHERERKSSRKKKRPANLSKEIGAVDQTSLFEQRRKAKQSGADTKSKSSDMGKLKEERSKVQNMMEKGRRRSREFIKSKESSRDNNLCENKKSNVDQRNKEAPTDRASKEENKDANDKKSLHEKKDSVHEKKEVVGEGKARKEKEPGEVNDKVPEKTRDVYDMTKDCEENSTDPAYIWCRETLAKKTFRGLFREFLAIKHTKPDEYTTEYCTKNEPKNRYNDILCIDKTRVVLQNRGKEDDYIHASWMIMPDQQKYISTQGPLPETIEDFWHMVFTEKSTVIVMLCDYNEDMKDKCARYYPRQRESVEKYGIYKVQYKESRPQPFDTIKYHIIEVDNGEQTMTVHHLANHQWTDHIAPDKPEPTVGLLKLARQLSEGNPITVHCSAGIGRTATYIGIDYASQKIRKNKDVNMIDVFKELRTLRFHAIQSVLQYIFLHICVLEYFVEENLYPRTKRYEEFVDECVKAGARCVASMKRKNEKGKENMTKEKENKKEELVKEKKEEPA